MRVYVTGASGFVGRHVVDALRSRGAEVRDERVDLLDTPALERVMDGCEAVVHVAALYSYEAPEEALRRVNVDGTRSVLEAAACAGVRRLVHTSTAGTCGPVQGRRAAEADAMPAWEQSVPYKRTKLAAERLALIAGAVVVNPTAPLGAGDERPTPTGRMVAGVARRRVRGYLPGTGLNVVDVPLGELFARIAALAGISPPSVRVPYALVRAAAAVGLVNRHEVRLARLPMYFDSAKAERELGYRAGPVEPALELSVREALSLTARRAASARAEPAIPSRT